MGNLFCREKDEDAWKQQNMEMEVNPAYGFANLAKGGSLIEAYNNEGPKKVAEIARTEMQKFFYHSDGRKHAMTKDEFIMWQTKATQKLQGTENIEYKEDDFNKFYPHDACWDLNKRGGVGETPFHLLYLMDSPVHFECANVLLQLYPNLSLDVYEGEEYFGESSLHIAIVVGDLESVKALVKAGADVHQRATGRFFLPEDQKLGYTKDTNYYGYAYYGEYPLAFAASLGNTDIYDYLLEHEADPNRQDTFGNTVLHMVVIADQRDMYKYAVRHHRRRAKTDIKNNQNLTPLTLACKLGRHNIFKEMMDLDALHMWQFSTTMCSAHPLRTLDSVGPDGNTNWDSALMIIVNGEKDEHLEMLEGGVMRQLIDEKWKTFARKRFIIRLIIAILHLTLFSIAVYTRPAGPDLMGYRGPIDGVRYASEIVVCFSCLVTVFHEVTEISTQGIISFLKNCTHAPAQTVYILSCLLFLGCIPVRFLGFYNAEDILLILCAPAAWFFLLFFARVRQLTGPFVTMIYQMCTGDLYRFAIIYIIFLFGFTQGFYFLYQDVPHTNSDTQKFSTLPETVLNLFQMTLGEFKYEAFNFSHYAPLTKIIFALFMIMVPILLLNMLIAMMGNTYTQVIQKSEKEWRKQWAKIVVVLERGLSKKKLLAYQQAYSIKLEKDPPEESEMALVVIKQSSKSRAKTRKHAVFNWKMLGKEIVRQLRLKKPGGAPFELQESIRRHGSLSARDGDLAGMSLLTDTVNQLAWEKDIDLTKGSTALASMEIDRGLLSPSTSGPRTPNRQIPNGSTAGQQPSKDGGGAGTASSSSTRLNIVQEENTQLRHRGGPELPTPIKKKKNLVYHNRVAPLLPLSPKEKTPFSDTDFTDIKEAPSERASYQTSTESQQYSIGGSSSSEKHGPSSLATITGASIPESRMIEPDDNFFPDKAHGISSISMSKDSTTTAVPMSSEKKSKKRKESKTEHSLSSAEHPIMSDSTADGAGVGGPSHSGEGSSEGWRLEESSSAHARVSSHRKGHRRPKGKGHGHKKSDSSLAQLLEMTGSSKDSKDEEGTE